MRRSAVKSNGREPCAWSGRGPTAHGLLARRLFDLVGHAPRRERHGDYVGGRKLAERHARGRNGDGHVRKGAGRRAARKAVTRRHEVTFLHNLGPVWHPAGLVLGQGREQDCLLVAALSREDASDRLVDVKAALRADGVAVDALDNADDGLAWPVEGRDKLPKAQEECQR